MVLFPCRTVVQRYFSIPFNYISLVLKDQSNSKTIERSNTHTFEPSDDRTVKPSSLRTLEPSNLQTVAPLNHRTLLISLSKVPESLRYFTSVRECNLLLLFLVNILTVWTIFCNKKPGMETIKILNRIKFSLRTIAVSAIVIFVFLFLINGNSFAQPSWNSGPTISPNPLSLDLSFNLNKASNVYFYVMPGSYNPIPLPAPGSVRFNSLQALPFGSILANDEITYSGAIVGNNYTHSIYREIGSFSPNTQYVVMVVAQEISTGLYTSVFRLVTTTLSCPSIYVGTAFNNADRCVNGDGANKAYDLTTYDGFGGNYSNVLKDATWTISWGDGSPDYTFTSLYDNDGPGNVAMPGMEFLSIPHTYTVHDSCYRRAVLTIKNPAGCATVGFQTERKDVLLAGRDWDPDGNGSQLVVNAATGRQDTIKVCEGQEAFITLRDDGIWDCDQTFKIYPPGEMNSSDRNVQFVYGMHPQTKAVENTITGPVTITGTYPGTATTAAGHASGVIKIPTAAMNPITNPHTLSDVIKIPNTAVYKQKIHVYFKNWNKCNPYIIPANEWDGTAVWDSIVIYIDRTPPPPNPNNQTICVNDPVPALTVTSPQATAFYWYSDINLLTIAPGSNNTNTYNTGISNATPSTTTFYVTQVQGTINGCVSPATPVTLTINPLPDITLAVGDPAICSGVTASISIANSVLGTSYQLRLDSNDSNVGAPVNGAGGTINLSASPGSTTVYNVLATIVATGCDAELTDKSTVTVYGLPTITTSNAPATIAAVCYSTLAQTTTMAYTSTTNSPTSYSIDWDNAANTAGLADQPNTAFAFVGGAGTINNIDITAGVATGTYDGTMTIRNANGCTGTKTVRVIVNPNPTITTTATPAVITAVCYSTSSQTTIMAYTGTTNSPTSYIIDWDATANLAGLTDQANTLFAFTAVAGTINNISIPASVAAGTYNGIMTVMNANGCSGTKSVRVIVNSQPTITTAATPAIIAAVCL